MLTRIGEVLAAYLNRPIRGFVPLATYSATQLRAALEPADVLLVEGNLRISTAIKYPRNPPGRTRRFTWARSRGKRRATIHRCSSRPRLGRVLSCRR